MPHDPLPTSKRKPADLDDRDPHELAKRARKEIKPSSKRKLNGDEQHGGLVFVRTSPLPSTSQTSQAHSQAHPSRPSSTQPVKKRRANSRPTTPSRDTDPPPDDDADADAAMRAMNSEADILRARARAYTLSSPARPVAPEFRFPPPPTAAESSVPAPKPRSKAAAASTPKLDFTRRRGKSAGRRALPAMSISAVAKGQDGDKSRRSRPDVSGVGGEEEGKERHRRRSSMSTRGKRVSSSFDQSGVITQPHPSVSDSSLHRHIDADLPESQRARQLLIWAAARAARLPLSSSSRPASVPSTTHLGASAGLPPLDDAGARLLRGVADGVVRMLAEKRIDTNVFAVGPPASRAEGKGKEKRENEQNTKNRAREAKFKGEIERLTAEDAAWTRVGQFWDTHQAAVYADVEARLAAARAAAAAVAASAAASASPKGKARAEVDALLDGWAAPTPADVPLAFRREDGLALARRVLREAVGADASTDERGVEARVEGLAFRIDRLRERVAARAKQAQRDAATIDARFAALQLASRGAGPPASSASMLPTLAGPSTSAPRVPPAFAFFPAPPLAGTSKESPSGVLRALARADAARAPEEASYAVVQTAREVRRAQEAPQTPRKGAAAGAGAPGTPGRTPRRGGPGGASTSGGGGETPGRRR